MKTPSLIRPRRAASNPFGLRPAQHSQPPRLTSPSAFSLMELVGVLAIIAIMAAVVAPNAIRAIDRAAVRAEVENLKVFGEQLKLHLIDRGSLPTASTWASSVAVYSDLAQADVQTNKRGMARVYVTDTSKTPVERLLIVSCMHAGLLLPDLSGLSSTAFEDAWTEANLVSAARHLGVTWDDESILDYFVMQRVNVASIYQKELKTYTITLNNASQATQPDGSLASLSMMSGSPFAPGNSNGNNGNTGNGNGNNGNGNGNGGSGGTGGGSGSDDTGGSGGGGSSTPPPGIPASFLHVRADKTSGESGVLNPGDSVAVTGCKTHDEIHLFNTATLDSTPDYVYVVSHAGCTLQFTPSGQWIAR